MRLTPGQLAPDFSATDLNLRRVSLADFRGRPLYLAFHRFAACPWCNFRIHQLKTRYKALHDKGLEIVAVFESGPDSLRKGAGNGDPPFTMLSDPEHTMYERYGVEASLLGLARSVVRRFGEVREFRHAIKNPELGQTITRMPADFLIEPSGAISVAYYGSDAGDHLAFEDIERWLVS